MSKRIAPLDALRTFAAFGVVWIHCWSYAGNPSLKIGSLDFYRIIAILGNGVNFFFVISGFFMYQVLNKNEFSAASYWDFICRRWKRIAPAFYFSAVVYALYFLLQNYHYPFFTRLLQNFTFLQNIYVGSSIIAPFWSLGTEWHFYLLLPLLFWSKNKKYFFIGLTGLSFISLIFSALINKGILPGEVWKYQISTRFIEFGMGCLAAYFYQNSIKLPNFIKGVKGIVLALVITYFGRLLLTKEILLLNYGWVFHTLAEPVMDFGYALFLYLLITQKTRLAAIFSKPIFTYLGKISYSVYLWHTFFILLLWKIEFKGITNPALNSILVFFIVALPTIVIAHFSYKFFEEPYFKRRNK